MALFFVSKGALADPRDARIRESSASGAARRRGYSLSRKRVSPFVTPERKDEGPSPSTPHIGSFGLEELHALRNRVRCTWLRHESLRVVTVCNRALLREARVTAARRQTTCGRDIAALAAYKEMTASAVVFLFF